MGEPRIIDTSELDDGVNIREGSSTFHPPRVRS
ncbi:N-acetyltransferase, partial [Mycobacterium tuberculosis variant bovis]